MPNDDEIRGDDPGDDGGDAHARHRAARWRDEPRNGRVRLSPIALGLALGITLAISVFFLGVVAAALGWGVLLAQVLSSVMVGYGPTVVGAIAGAVWAFVIGFVNGVVIAWFYNRFLPRRHGG